MRFVLLALALAASATMAAQPAASPEEGKANDKGAQAAPKKKADTKAAAPQKASTAHKPAPKKSAAPQKAAAQKAAAPQNAAPKKEPEKVIQGSYSTSKEPIRDTQGNVIPTDPNAYDVSSALTAPKPKK